MADLTELVARAIREAEARDAHVGATTLAAAVLAALRDPPPPVIEAGAKAMYAASGGHVVSCGLVDGPDVQHFRTAFLASWRAALDATSSAPLQREPRQP